MCPHCGSPRVLGGGIATWAMVLGILLTFSTCVFGIPFFFIRDDYICAACGFRWK